MHLGIFRDIKTIIGGVPFPLTYIILQPLMKKGYDVLIGRPWLYGARVQCDWQRKRLQFRHPSDPEGALITVPWAKIPHEGKTPSTSLGYTTAEDNTSSDDDVWDVRYVACCAVEQELEDNQEETDSQLTIGLGRSETSHTEGVVNPSDCREVTVGVVFMTSGILLDHRVSSRDIAVDTEKLKPT
ncbi:hypothetical protein AXG93_4008s1030 [Marchantia polymorpha subsp. ruderalis]|uniref:Uncharacterized protein n=1 Tax=Marchantia polymorpha subsp. ruderalis TaxID=1480154 RepID=A0A176W9K5_MARPO|nr:hypothetical protein AXG93_4008s1030 [Marchantia polymorpha subsp. ruderalis]